jgi:hypothetical protein
MRKAFALVWVVIPPLLFSALIHSTDPDVGGLRGLASLSTLLSVVVYGLPVVVLTLACLWLAVRCHWAAWVSASVLVSATVALTIALLQTPRAPGWAGIARPFLGGKVLVWLFMAAAVLPARLLGWPAYDRQSELEQGAS